MIRRLSSFMVALWFALYVGAPQLLHPCPQHAVMGARGAMGATGTMSGAMRHHAGMATGRPGDLAERDASPAAARHAHGALPSSDAPSPDPADDHQCCCPGPQCGSAAVVVVPATAWIDVTFVSATVAIVEPRLAPPSSRLAHTLPYATAPPAAREA